jgi:hypothetical protein
MPKSESSWTELAADHWRWVLPTRRFAWDKSGRHIPQHEWDRWVAEARRISPREEADLFASRNLNVDPTKTFVEQPRIEVERDGSDFITSWSTDVTDSAGRSTPHFHGVIDRSGSLSDLFRRAAESYDRARRDSENAFIAILERSERELNPPRASVPPGIATFECQRCNRQAARSFDNRSIPGDECSCETPLTNEQLKQREMNNLMASMSIGGTATALCGAFAPIMFWLLGIPVFVVALFVLNWVLPPKRDWKIAG